MKTLEKYSNITIAAKVGVNSGERVMPRSVYPEKFYSMIDVVPEYGYVTGLKIVSNSELKNLLEPLAYRMYRLYTKEPLGSGLSNKLFTWLGD